MIEKNILLGLYGGPLQGSAPVYYIYSDEAGTSQRENITIVVGVVLNADRSWRSTQERLRLITESMVPKQIREGFIFHAKDVRSGYRELDSIWPTEDRFRLIKAVASIPREMGLAISVCKIRRDADKKEHIPGMPIHDFQHVMAFGRCMARANKYIHDWAAPEEVATLVSEDTQKKRRFLKAALKAPPVALPLAPSHLRLTMQEKTTGNIKQTNAGAIDRIIDTVHFVAKDEAPLLQIADACAYTFRRYLENQSFGLDLISGMLGGDLVWDDWQGPISEMTFSFNPEHRYP